MRKTHLKIRQIVDVILNELDIRVVLVEQFPDAAKLATVTE